MSLGVTRRGLLLGAAASGLEILGAQPSATVALQHATVIDVASGSLRPGQTVLIKGDRIASVGSSAASARQVVNAKGQFIIPGLWDMHTHLWTDPPLFGLYLKNGVTGIRDMGSPPQRTREWRRQISSGQKPGPRILTAGTPIDGPGPRIAAMPTLTADGPNEARRAGDEWEKESVDFIKVLGNLSRDSYRALASAARQMRWPMAGHLSEQLTASEAVYARQESIEHLFGMMLSCSGEEASMRGKKRDMAMAQQMMDAYSPAKAKDLFDLMRRYDTYLTPTLVLHRRMAQIGLDELMSDAQLATVPGSIRKGWSDPRTKLTTEEAAFQKRQFERHQVLVKDMQASGVRLLAGTDTGDDYVVPGASLHDELAQMVDAGLTPLQALQTATRHPAAFLHLDDRMGAVEKGRYADLVILDGNPLVNIHNTRRVAGVVMAGRYFSKAQLDHLARA